MIKFQNANVNKTTCPHDVIEYTYIGLKAELDDFNARKKALENEFWFCPDTGDCYYWNKDAQQFLLLGTGYTPPAPPEPEKLKTPNMEQTDTDILWGAVDHADFYTLKSYNLDEEPVLVDTYTSSDLSVSKEVITERMWATRGTGGHIKSTITAGSNSAEYSESDPAEIEWDADDPVDR